MINVFREEYLKNRYVFDKDSFKVAKNGSYYCGTRKDYRGIRSEALYGKFFIPARYIVDEVGNRFSVDSGIFNWLKKKYEDDHPGFVIQLPEYTVVQEM